MINYLVEYGSYSFLVKHLLGAKLLLLCEIFNFYVENVLIYWSIICTFGLYKQIFIKKNETKFELK